MPQKKTGLSRPRLVGFLAVFSLSAFALFFGGTQTVFAAVPQVDSVSIRDAGNNDITSVGLLPVEGGLNNVTVSGQVSDTDGCSDIQNVTVYLSRSGVWNSSTASCPEDDNNCYSVTVPAQDLTGCVAGSSTAMYAATIGVKNFADPTDTGTYTDEHWLAGIVVTDDSAQSANSATTTFELQSLAAFSVTAQIEFGTVDLGQYSDYQEVVFTNTGNINVDTDIRADGPLTSNLSGFSIIPSQNILYALNDEFDHASGTPLTTQDATLNIHLPQQTAVDGGIPPTKRAYFLLHMPATGVNGRYSNVVTFTARAQGVDCDATPTNPDCRETLTSLDPSSRTRSTGNFTQIVHGTKLNANDWIYWNGSHRTTTFVDATTVTCTIGYKDYPNPGPIDVYVHNTVSGWTTNHLTFTIE